MIQSFSKYQKFLIVGAGSSGKGAAKLLSNQQKQIRLTTDTELSADDKVLCSGLSIKWEELNHTDAFIDWSEVCVLSPGVKPDSVIVQKIRDANKKIISEVDLASIYLMHQWVGITGSNGKTSTSTLIAKTIAETGNLDLCGNIGKSFCESVLENENQLKVVELSSFQLKFSSHIKPFISIILNLSPNHLNWHTDLIDYYESKLSLISKTEKKGFVILNFDDEELRLRAHFDKLNCIWFSLHSEEADYFLIEGRLFNNQSGKRVDTGVSFMDDRLQMPLLNYVASSICCLKLGINSKQINRVNQQFLPLKHRIQTVGIRNEIQYVNDSKSTTEASTLQALQACGNRVILLAGGVLKVNEFKALEQLIDKHVIHLIVFGSGAKKLHSIFNQKVKTSIKNNLNEAFAIAQDLAIPGDTILLSPMCASFDQFKSFEERGDAFMYLVENQMKAHSTK